MPKYVCVPQNECLRDSINGFHCRWDFPQTVGTIDRMHIPILRPKESGSIYYNRKGYHPILMQAIVEFRGLFIDVNIGWPGKVQNARVFANLSCYRKGTNGTMFPNWPRTIGGVSVPLVILGDAVYLLLPWLMKPYLENASTTRQQHNYNYRHSRARMIVENAFGHLKGRWRCLLKRIDSPVLNVSNIVASCTVLHNICDTTVHRNGLLRRYLF